MSYINIYIFIFIFILRLNLYINNIYLFKIPKFIFKNFISVIFMDYLRGGSGLILFKIFLETI